MSFLKKILAALPKPLEAFLFSTYHLTLAYAGAIFHRLPSRMLFVVGITGTKGKTTVTEIVNAIFEEWDKKTILSNTIRFKTAHEEKRNLYKMSMPGRFFIQSLLDKGVALGATHATLEITSEGAKQHRHRGIALDALIFTNLSPEHIESHGSFEAYGEAKLSIGHALERSRKRPRYIVAPADDPWGKKFLSLNVEKKIPFTLDDAKPYGEHEGGVYLTVRGKRYESPLTGEVNIKNILAAILLAREVGVPEAAIARAVQKLKTVSGRFENVNEGGEFPVIVDYAHTPESLEAVYQAFNSKRKICVLGATGGGRDKWKRPRFGALAEQYCNEIILTDEDPYDEDPMVIINEVAAGMQTKKPTIVLDRKGAIQKAITLAGAGDAVLLTGKGTDPYIMGPNGSKTPWNEAEIARTVLQETI